MTSVQLLYMVLTNGGGNPSHMVHTWLTYASRVVSHIWRLQQALASLSPITFIFMQFSAKILPNNKFLHQIQGLVTTPQLRNPGSATGKSHICRKVHV